ncbi:malonate decarboxylase holo-[acyl-carrier-protein] synthase [uncultured Rhodoblastus sp.]|uniref:malonate decarboxylase holo-[acyl-carrier-protein] synthase n=1 Tax=uncultured Rhodoblastus sp. TaxID=543037 RepID=UPI00260019A4|nr:malonate decarboxylase holo-[acyl-carrier-protein] synthase [uncultured Rhodoblastus sp.]
MRSLEPLRRHDWVFLKADWRRWLAAPIPASDEQALAQWLETDRPLVVARRGENDAPGLLRLGLALPGKRRVGLVLSAEAVTRRRPPPLFFDAVKSSATFWPDAMRELAAALAGVAPDTGVFGSFAWQFFAADPAMIYVTRESDIDLLLAPADSARCAAWIALLQDFELRWPAPRLDGEIVLPDGDFIGDFISWREFAARPEKILVKGANHVSLRPIEDIDALLRARAA